jgi:endonuclease YncB( thermonuclease family)
VQWLTVVMIAFATGALVADYTLPWREQYGLTTLERPLARPTLLQVGIGQRYTVKVLRILDGDTMEVAWPDGARVRVRLTDIDAPESCQPYGPEATRALRDYVGKGTIEVEVVDVDRNQRVIGRVFADGRDVSAALVRDGAAWFYAEYARDPSIFDLENEARDAERGLWSLPLEDRIEPWEFRREVRCPPPR